MLPKYFDLIKGSSLTFSAQGGWGKEKNNAAAKNPGVGQGQESLRLILLCKIQKSRSIF